MHDALTRECADVSDGSFESHFTPVEDSTFRIREVRHSKVNEFL